jgi:rhodanese-related sulfurtransferase
MPTRKLSSSKQAPRRGSLPRWILWVSIGLLVVLAVVVYFVARSSQKATQMASQTPTIALPVEISVDEAFLLFGGKTVLFLDVRPTTSWKAFHIENSVSIPLAEIPARLNELPHTGVIVIVDGSGDLSPQARSILQKAGFSKVGSMTGGLDAWIQRGFPIIGTVPL